MTTMDELIAENARLREAISKQLDEQLATDCRVQDLTRALEPFAGHELPERYHPSATMEMFIDIADLARATAALSCPANGLTQRGPGA